MDANLEIHIKVWQYGSMGTWLYEYMTISDILL